MKLKRFDNKIIVRIDKGEEILESLLSVCRDHDVSLASIVGIGATNRATIGLFDVKAKRYHSQKLIGNYEIVSLCGNVCRMNDELYLHLHIAVCDDHQHCFGGHLNAAIVSATCECVIDCIDGAIERFFDEKTGLNLLKI